MVLSTEVIAMRQLAFPGMEPPQKLRPLHVLYWDAWAEYWAPIVERVATERELGLEGIVPADLEGVPDFLDMEEFRTDLERRGVAFR